MFEIGTLSVKHGLVLAPLAGISDPVFRTICISCGAEMVFTEMVSAEGVRRRMKRTLSYLDFGREEHPIAVQIFGSDGDCLSEAAQIVEDEHRPDVIDINLGCPVRKVTRTGAGAALLKDRRRLGAIVSRVVSAVHTPVSAKIRLGWKENHSLEIAQTLTDCGIHLLTVHARTARSGFDAKADWDAFEPIRERISIPLIANGDITDPEDVAYLLKEVGVAGVMIGRGAIGRPWIFTHMRDYLIKGTAHPLPGAREQFEFLLDHMDIMERRYGAVRAVGRMKKHIPYYLKGIAGRKKRIHVLLTSKTFDELRKRTRQIAAEFQRSDGDSE
jgi:tRNA-dihydrouridine synthase B